MGIYLLFPNPCTPSHQTTLVENRQEGKGNGIPNHVSTQGFETLFFFFPFIISFSIHLQPYAEINWTKSINPRDIAKKTTVDKEDRHFNQLELRKTPTIIPAPKNKGWR